MSMSASEVNWQPSKAFQTTGYSVLQSIVYILCVCMSCVYVMGQVAWSK